MKLTAQEIMRYAAETEREETLIGYIENRLPDIEQLETDCCHLDDDLERAKDHLREIQELTNGDLEDSEIISAINDVFMGLGVDI